MYEACVILNSAQVHAIVAAAGHLRPGDERNGYLASEAEVGNELELAFERDRRAGQALGQRYDYVDTGLGG